MIRTPKPKPTRAVGNADYLSNECPTCQAIVLRTAEQVMADRREFPLTWIKCRQCRGVAVEVLT